MDCIYLFTSRVQSLEVVGPLIRVLMGGASSYSGVFFFRFVWVALWLTTPRLQFLGVTRLLVCLLSCRLDGARPLAEKAIQYRAKCRGASFLVSLVLMLATVK